MRNASRFRPSPALVISFIALSVSISGVAWAAATIGTSDIKNGAVTKKKLHKNAVTTNKIKNDAVNGAKVNESTLGTVPNASNANHANNADNATNASNASNASALQGKGLSAFTGSNLIVRRANVAVPASTRQFAARSCNAGEVIVGGGVRFENLNDDDVITYSAPAGSNAATPASDGQAFTAWQASGLNGLGADTLHVYAICASIP